MTPFAICGKGVFLFVFWKLGPGLTAWKPWKAAQAENLSKVIQEHQRRAKAAQKAAGGLTAKIVR